MNIDEAKRITLINKIKAMSDLRYEYIVEHEASYNDEKMDYEKELNPKVGELANEIYNLLSKHRESFPFEFIFEQLTMLGQAPSLVYDDNGYFAVTGDGFQEVVTEPSDLEISHYVLKDAWKPTVREALYYYLDED